MSTTSGNGAVIFDFDGVLADTEALAYRIICRIAEQRGTNAPSIEFLKNHRTQEIMDAMRIRWWQLPYYVALGRRWATQERGGIRLFPWAGELLAAAKRSAGRVFIVSSNAETNIRALLEANGLQPQVERIIGSVGMFGKKRKIAALLRSEGLDPSRALFFGDETRDIEAGRAVGVRTVAVSWGLQSVELLRRMEPAYILTDPDSAREFFREFYCDPAAVV